MSAYAAQGQRHLVARAYRRCCDGLEELGLKPSVALEQAYQAMSQELPGHPGRLMGSSGRATSPPSSAALSAGKPNRPRSAGWYSPGAW